MLLFIRRHLLNVVIIARCERKVKEAYTKLRKAAQQMGLTINHEQTKYTEVSDSETKEKPSYIRINKTVQCD
jgi:hypothetical protein